MPFDITDAMPLTILLLITFIIDIIFSIISLAFAIPAIDDIIYAPLLIIISFTPLIISFIDADYFIIDIMLMPLLIDDAIIIDGSWY